ncbi:cell wall-binding repeat-containing protein [Bacillus sp. HMF5848]|uniref:cell wall-binding repeat-containing protein n=1 Tax=Bacillus sp. HMF5848 TaxID=2495421 RepID=UPI000F7ADD0F|nr:cell wall-binding repeat-containing protein [Bacillus sp. HMF5848]RSK26671.1 cell wall-binding repeat-containing protein [Bacillus sp. HMF5848]
MGVTRFIIIALAFILIAGCNNQQTNKSVINETSNSNSEAQQPDSFNESSAQALKIESTKNVTRLMTDNPIELSVMVSQTIWPATHEANRPGSVILSPVEQWQIGLASVDLIHHPNNGPVLFTVNGEIPVEVLNELERLNPKGTVDGTQVMVMGTVGEKELDKLSSYKVKAFKGDNASEFANAIDDYYNQLTNDIPKSVIIASMDETAKLYSLPAANWIAHMEEPLLYVEKDNVPKATIQALEKRNGKANMYLFGPKTVISEKVERELLKYGNVVRIEGETPSDQSIAFAKFKDDKTKFGWGFNKPGHGFSFISTETPEYAIVAAPFSHLGKHAPLLWLEDGELTDNLYSFLKTLKPYFEDDPTLGPYNQGYISGSFNNVSFQMQGLIDDVLEIGQLEGMEHGGH